MAEVAKLSQCLLRILGKDHVGEVLDTRAGDEGAQLDRLLGAPFGLPMTLSDDARNFLLDFSFFEQPIAGSAARAGRITRLLRSLAGVPRAHVTQDEQSLLLSHGDSLTPAPLPKKRRYACIQLPRNTARPCASVSSPRRGTGALGASAVGSRSLRGRRALVSVCSLHAASCSIDCSTRFQMSRSHCFCASLGSPPSNTRGRTPLANRQSRSLSSSAWARHSSTSSPQSCGARSAKRSTAPAKSLRSSPAAASVRRSAEMAATTSPG